jgi:AraC-like DNA-binding protein
MMIGKTRHLPTPLSREQFGQGCGTLRHSSAPAGYRHTRHAPSPALASWVRHFWIETWDLDGAAPRYREILPHPCVNLVFVPGRSRVFGVQLGRFNRELRGQGCVVGVKFRPGAFHSFLRRPISAMANMSLPLESLFAGAAEAERDVFAGDGEAAMIDAATRFLVDRLPAADPLAEKACAIVETVAADREITRVEHIMGRWKMGERALQRLFARYVGASARWVIKRYRVYEALERLHADDQCDWAHLALELGYFDQAHFINDFRKLVGSTPVDYHRACRSPLPS